MKEKKEKKSLQDFYNFLEAHKLNELLCLRILPEMLSREKVFCSFTLFFFFFFLIHMENKCINANRIILSQENWLGISLQGIARHLKYCLPESPGDEGCRTRRLSDCSSLISLYRQLGNDYCSLISLYRQQRSQQ